MAVCENCAGDRDEDELVPVWPAETPDAGAPQLWCDDCRGSFGHETAEDDTA